VNNGAPKRRSLRTVGQLLERGLIDDTEGLAGVEARFAVAVTPHVADRIAEGSAGMGAQFVPTRAELRFEPEERSDPIGDEPYSPLPGLTHRYPDRVLLKPVHVCPVYCRFCFRREQVGPDGEVLDPRALDQALGWIASREGIREVILTGGDPLILSPRRMAGIIRRLARIPHVDVVRLHTRVPVVDPTRVTPEMLDALRAEGVATWVAVHTNHPDELDDASTNAMARLVDHGIPLISQTVLLRGVNNDVTTLTALFRGLVRRRVKPYYLHHGDLALGTGHFRTSLAEGRALVDALRGRLSGLCQPTYVLDIPGGHGKVPAAAPWVVEGDAEAWKVRDWTGGVHRYPVGKR